MRFLVSDWWFLIVGIWYAANGILHDIFVFIRHKGGYDRELLRLLMDGHVLLLSGALLILCWFMRAQGALAVQVSLVCGLFMVIYCFMIFPFLKSIVTLVLSMMLCIFCVFSLWNM